MTGGGGGMVKNKKKKTPGLRSLRMGGPVLGGKGGKGPLIPRKQKQSGEHAKNGKRGKGVRVGWGSVQTKGQRESPEQKPQLPHGPAETPSYAKYRRGVLPSYKSKKSHQDLKRGVVGTGMGTKKEGNPEEGLMGAWVCW